MEMDHTAGVTAQALVLRDNLIITFELRTTNSPAHDRASLERAEAWGSLKAVTCVGGRVVRVFVCVNVYTRVVGRKCVFVYVCVYVYVRELEQRRSLQVF